MTKIPDLNNPNDWLDKAKYDYDRYLKSFGSYEFIDALLTLNAIPEWVVNHSDNDPLIKETEDLLKVMKGHNRKYTEIDERLLISDILMKMRFLRLFCNYSKHPKDKKSIPKIEKRYGATFPIVFEAAFRDLIYIGDNYVLAQDLISDIINYWDERF